MDYFKHEFRCPSNSPGDSQDPFVGELYTAENDALYGKLHFIRTKGKSLPRGGRAVDEAPAKVCETLSMRDWGLHSVKFTLFY